VVNTLQVVLEQYLGGKGAHFELTQKVTVHSRVGTGWGGEEDELSKLKRRNNSWEVGITFSLLALRGLSTGKWKRMRGH
jgi:hypothetical protein